MDLAYGTSNKQALHCLWISTLEELSDKTVSLDSIRSIYTVSSYTFLSSLPSFTLIMNPFNSRPFMYKSGYVKTAKPAIGNRVEKWWKARQARIRAGVLRQPPRYDEEKPLNLPRLVRDHELVGYQEDGREVRRHVTAIAVPAHVRQPLMFETSSHGGRWPGLVKAGAAVLSTPGATYQHLLDCWARRVAPGKKKPRGKPSCSVKRRKDALAALVRDRTHVIIILSFECFHRCIFIHVI